MSTQRTKAALDTLFADNHLRQVTPARLRDFLESSVPSMGGLHFSEPGTPTTIATQSVFVKAANVSTLHGEYRFSMTANNRLKYVGVAEARAIVIATLSFTCADDAQVLAFALAVNGSVVTSSIVRTKVAIGADIQSVTIMDHPTLEPNDYVEVWIANDTSDADITIEHGQLHGVAFLT